MDIDKQIVDQRIRKIVSEHSDWFPNTNNETQRLSKAFVLLGVSAYLKIKLDEALMLITDGGHDAGIDAIHIGQIEDGEFTVTIFQGKYVFNLEKSANFPANSILSVINSVNSIFDTSKTISVNPLLKAYIEEIRSRMLLDYHIPRIKCVFINNGLPWKDDGQNYINNVTSDKISFEHVNHHNIINTLQSRKITQSVVLKFSGISFVENFNYKRVLVGKINVLQIVELFNKYGDDLLERNVRGYLGLHKNRVNNAIERTLTSDKKDNFYFYNNGITIVCSQFSYNSDLTTRDGFAKVRDLQIINGGQSCKTIVQTIEKYPDEDYSQAFVLVRLYELTNVEADAEQLVNDVTLATNSQNPVDLRDLRANDVVQKGLILSVEQLGYVYKSKRDISANGEIIPSSVAAEAVFAIWRKRPHQAKWMQNELFGKFYNDIFNELNGAQLVLAVLIYRFCDNQRRKEALILQYPHIPYSNYFLSMIMAFIVLKDLKIDGVAKLTHLNFDEAKQYFEANKEQLFERSNQVLIKALNNICPAPRTYDKLELRSLSAIFRRGDLMEYIDL